MSLNTVAIVGSTDIKDATYIHGKLKILLDEFFPKVKEVIIIGRNDTRPLPGVALHAYTYANKCGLKCTIVPQNWSMEASSTVMITNAKVVRMLKGNNERYGKSNGGLIFLFDIISLVSTYGNNLLREALLYNVPVYGLTIPIFGLNSETTSNVEEKTSEPTTPVRRTPVVESPSIPVRRTT